MYSVNELLGLVQLDERGDGQEILDILRRIDDKVTDKKSFVETANRIVDSKPNFFGLGINLNELFCTSIGHFTYTRFKPDLTYALRNYVRVS